MYRNNRYTWVVVKGCILCVFSMFATIGCGSKPVAAEADLKKSFEAKPFDINNVPPDKREMVRGIMEAQKAKKK